jgi:Zn-dependent M28 family amino/carboxypeptidase
LVRLGNAARGDAIVGCLRDLNLTPTLVPIPDEPLSNVLALLHQEGPYTLFVAHYDKSRETAAYQAASDNTAAVCALLEAARDLAESPPRRPVAFLFTAAEERGCRGAEAFLSWAGARGLDMVEVINFDMIGRGKLASRPSALPGFYFWLPGLGQVVYNGRGVARGKPYPSPDPGLISRLKALLGDDLVTYQRFTARSDSNVFQAAGIPTVSLSSDDMYYLELVWERDADRLELLDADNLDLARRLVVDYAGRAA